MNLYIWTGAAFLAGLIIAWLIRTVSVSKLRKELKSMSGLLESERLMRETMQKENRSLLQNADAGLITSREELKKLRAELKRNDEDIILLQKNNEETEALLAKKEPAVNELRLKLIEAQNTIARLKGTN